MDFTITLLSNADSSNAEGINTLSNFSNYIQPPININSYEWEYAVQSMFCHNEFKNAQNDFLEVSCDLTSPLAHQSNTIAFIARPKETDGKIASIYYEPFIKEYFPVATNYISNINIQIWTTKEGSSVSYERDLLGGQPTVVKLHFRRRNMFSTDYVIRVESDKAKNPMYPKNTCQSFWTNLGREFSFDPETSNLEVALSSITYKPQFQMSGDQYVYVHQYNAKDTTKEIFKKKIELFSGVTLKQYISYINDKVLSVFKTSTDPVDIMVDYKVSRNGKKRLFLVANKKCVIQLPYSVMYNMGERGFIPIEGMSESDASDSYSFKLILGTNQIYEFAAVPDPFAFFPDMGFVYCDFIQGSYIGNGSAPILKSFPISHKAHNMDYHTYSVHNPEYYPLAKYDLSSVHFSIKDITGNLIPFQDLKSNVIITLLIRDRNKYRLF